MRLVIDGQLFSDPFGISWLRRKTKVHEDIDLSAIGAGKTFAFHAGMLSVGAQIEETDGNVYADIKASVGGLVIFDKKLTIAEHVAGGPTSVSVGGGQFSFSGTVQVLAA